MRIPEGARAGELFFDRDGEHGTLVVPENRAAPGSRLIRLPVRRFSATGPNPAEPIFHLAGGPGTSNLGFKPPAWLLLNHDVVLVGYRGVDGSPTLDCPEFALAVLGTGPDLVAPVSLDAMGEALSACLTRLRDEGVDLRGYRISEMVGDLEATRAALGFERINLLSESFGTRVAQVHAQTHPERVHRSVMIGVNPPGHFVWRPEVVDAQLEQYAALWRQTSGSAAPELIEAIRSVNADMPRRWLFFTIDPGKVRALAFVLLYHRSTAPMAFDAYLSASRGDVSGLALMSLAYDLLVPGMMTWGQFFALGCGEDFEPGRDYRTELNPQRSVLGSPMSLMIWGAAAGHWPTELPWKEDRRPTVSEVETLLISGSLDFSTPAQFAEDELLPTLRNGRHVVISEQGHTRDFWEFQPVAVQRLLTSFFEKGVADDSLFRTLPMNFVPAVRLPTAAKVLLVVLVLPLAALVVALRRRLWKLTRRAKRAGG